jgi:trehalose 6-phosphate synthase
VARLVIISNRVPAVVEGQQAGGLAVALEDALRHEALWFGWSGRITETTSDVAAVAQKGRITIATADLGREDYDDFYVGFSNSTLWPLLHYRLGLVEFARSTYAGYRRVNRRYAELVSPLLRPDDLIWVHDYHLIPLGAELRRLGHGNRIGFFLHIPFPPAAVFKALPSAHELLSDLTAYDLAGFQTPEDRDHFVDGARRLAGAAAEGEVVQLRGRRLRALAIPVGIDPDRFARLAERSARSEYSRRLQESVAGRKLIIGADRLDYSKGLLNRFEGFARLLERFGEHRRKVSYLQITPRSRREVIEYQALKRSLDRLAGKINGGFAEFDWVPLRYMTKAMSRTMLAGFYRVADVALVTPFRDGMNLVAKEFVAAQDESDPGVLVLSRFAGAATSLTEALLVNPHDAEEIAEALHSALTMPLDERQSRWRDLMTKVRRDSAAAWSQRFIAELEAAGLPGGQTAHVSPAIVQPAKSSMNRTRSSTTAAWKRAPASAVASEGSPSVPVSDKSAKSR